VKMRSAVEINYFDMLYILDGLFLNSAPHFLPF